MRRLIVLGLATGLLAVACSGSAPAATTVATTAATSSTTAPAPPVSPWDWPTYGHDAQHTFHGRTTLTPATATGLKQAWMFPTGDAVTATPTVVDGTVYAGSWDGFFYAVDLATGKLRWKFRLHPQPKISPQPGQVPRDFSSDGGMVTASAWYQRGVGGGRDLVIFGGGYTLYALDAATGKTVWSHDYTGRPEHPSDPAADETRIFSSPVVADGKVLFATSADGDDGYRGRVIAADLRTGKPDWVVETDTAADGSIPNDGCGNVWSSGTLLPAAGTVVFTVADCNFSSTGPYSETVLAVRVADGKTAWRYRPARPDLGCDWDFGATANAGIDAAGHATFLGVGAKDGTYYSLDPATGQERWTTNVVFGGLAGGFIATTAYDGTRVYGSTAIGDFGRFEGVGEKVCRPSDPRDTTQQEPTVHAFDATTGKVAYQASNAASFAPTTVAGGMTFNGVGLDPVIDVRSAADGKVLATYRLAAPCWSGIATVGNAIVFGTGASQQGSPDGIIAYTPAGAAPSVPSA